MCAPVVVPSLAAATTPSLLTKPMVGGMPARAARPSPNETGRTPQPFIRPRSRAKAVPPPIAARASRRRGRAGLEDGVRDEMVQAGGAVLLPRGGGKGAEHEGDLAHRRVGEELLTSFWVNAITAV